MVYTVIFRLGTFETYKNSLHHYRFNFFIPNLSLFCKGQLAALNNTEFN